MKGKIREILFNGFNGCTNHYCIINGNTEGMHTNGTCQCMSKMTRIHMTVIGNRLKAIGEIEIEIKTKEN